MKSARQHSGFSQKLRRVPRKSRHPARGGCGQTKNAALLVQRHGEHLTTVILPAGRTRHVARNGTATFRAGFQERSPPTIGVESGLLLAAGNASLGNCHGACFRLSGREMGKVEVKGKSQDFSGSSSRSLTPSRTLQMLLLRNSFASSSEVGANSLAGANRPAAGQVRGETLESSQCG